MNHSRQNLTLAVASEAGSSAQTIRSQSLTIAATVRAETVSLKFSTRAASQPILSCSFDFRTGFTP
ncbi:hypothetical protein PLANPX_1432 [Lacipirellula parvula]|uniref:Uncharacterized protein n=1 Tax=Lacipirellula parvula TaxID=2650471 RepID=A0A5K7X5K5_9BACT|nr:hypothetical protein PLANPX_1432 [Lacipirellula parvula]